MVTTLREVLTEAWSRVWATQREWTATATSPSGGTPSPTRCPCAPLCPATSKSTSASSARDSPACGPRRAGAGDPALRIVVVDKEVVGFGASGRNGGWCSALFSTSDAALARLYGIDAMRRMRRAMQSTVDEVGAAAHQEGIDCHFAKGGTVDAARTPAQRARAMADVEQARALGFGEGDLRWLDQGEAVRADRPRRDARRHVHPALRRHPTGAPRPRPGGRGRTSGRHHSRAHRGHRHHRRCAGSLAAGAHHGGAIKADVVVRAVEAWTLHLARPRSARWCRCTRSWWRPSPWAMPSGPGRDSRIGPPSPTTGTWSFTGSARRTAGSPSAGAGRPTTSAPTCAPPSTRRRRCTRSCARP